MAKQNGKGDQTKINAAALAQVRDELRAAFKEREQIVDGLLIAALAGEHIFLIGPPGTAKSAMARAFAGVLGGTYFELLMTRYTEPNEVFGPIDLQAWSQHGTYSRRTVGHFPDCHVAFLDEAMKANSSILNSLLAAINERVFHDDGKVMPIPLRTVVAASNELPEGSELEALFDRFILRYEARYVRDRASFAAVVRGALPAVTASMSLADLDAHRAAVEAVPVSDDVIDALFSLRSALEQEGFIVSDRRWRKLLRILQAKAYLEGDPEVDTIHFEVLTDGLWREPQDQVKIASVVARTASPALSEALEVHDAIMEQVHALPAAGDLGGAGRSVVAELKKAVARVEAIKANAKGRALAARIDGYVAALRTAHASITERIMKEMNLSI
jgi:MoxR-like ATPase